jgi:hypothetical protein
MRVSRQIDVVTAPRAGKASPEAKTESIGFSHGNFGRVYRRFTRNMGGAAFYLA